MDSDGGEAPGKCVLIEAFAVKVTGWIVLCSSTCHQFGTCLCLGTDNLQCMHVLVINYVLAHGLSASIEYFHSSGDFKKRDCIMLEHRALLTCMILIW